MTTWLMGGAIMLVGVGLYGLLISRNLIKLVVALQIMTKGSLLALVIAGQAAGRLQLSQSLVVTVIVVDTITAVIALALAILVKRHFGTLDVQELSTLKG